MDGESARDYGQAHLADGAPAWCAPAPAMSELPAPADPDAEQMLMYAGGDNAAFDRLYASHSGGTYRYFLRSLRNPGVAEELFQDLWMSVVRARASYTIQARFATWLYRMAHNRLIDHYRRSNVVELVPLDDDESALAPLLADPAPGPEAAATSRQAALQLLHLVEALPAVQREAFLLQEEGGLSLAEIAAATGAGVETIKSRLRYAMTRLREGMRNFT